LVAGQTGVERATWRKTVADCSIPWEWMQLVWPVPCRKGGHKCYSIKHETRI
jgi:hypothetical protein